MLQVFYRHRFITLHTTVILPIPDVEIPASCLFSLCSHSSVLSGHSRHQQHLLPTLHLLPTNLDPQIRHPKFVISSIQYPQPFHPFRCYTYIMNTSPSDFSISSPELLTIQVITMLVGFNKNSLKLRIHLTHFQVAPDPLS